MTHRRAIAMRSGEPVPDHELAAVVAIGTPRWFNSEAAEYIAEFAQSSEVHRVGLLFERTPNRIDWSFSRIVEAFKKADARWLIWNDADVLPTMGFDYAFTEVEKAYSEGFQVVASPCQNQTRAFSLRPIPLKQETIVTDRAFEVEFITGGHWWIHKSVVMQLPVTSRLKNAAGGYENMYLKVPDDTTEDAWLCEHIRRLGFKIGCLPLLLTDHLKIERLPSYRKGMAPPHLAGTKAPTPARRLPQTFDEMEVLKTGRVPTLAQRLEEAQHG